MKKNIKVLNGIAIILLSNRLFNLSDNNLKKTINKNNKNIDKLSKYGLAKHLTDKGIKVYTACWCGPCSVQKSYLVSLI